MTVTEHVDVLVVGAGISGVGAAYYLQRDVPDKTFAILEAREDLGGTWDLFRYPGIRSDSDLHTFGYAFKPWTDDKAIAEGPKIKDYIRETAEENGIAEKIRFGHKVRSASWSSDEARWTVEVEHAGETFAITADWLFSCCGYYSYEHGHTPEIPGLDRFAGPVVHPQFWPEDLDHRGKRVVVIGSGATAVTLLPAMADTGAHVTMLQRSPTYIISLPAEDKLANRLRKLLGEKRAYRYIRARNIRRQAMFYALSKKRPQLIRKLLRFFTRRQLPSGFAVDTHFKPRYDPWDQRLCLVPDGDLFRVLREGTAEIVTGEIETVTEHGIRLRSGQTLEADVIVTATGLDLEVFGGIGLTVDGAPVEMPDRFAYKGVMLSDVPNFSYVIGYSNASWTLRVDLACAYVCRVLAALDRRGADVAVPELDDPGMERRPVLDLASGYVQRSIHRFPSAGSEGPWTMPMNFAVDRDRFAEPVDDGVLRFRTRARAAEREAEPAPV
jgi:cation diffusion facilitator CzcD-associated flavoprotein CzcO